MRHPTVMRTAWRSHCTAVYCAAIAALEAAYEHDERVEEMDVASACGTVQLYFDNEPIEEVAFELNFINLSTRAYLAAVVLETWDLPEREEKSARMCAAHKEFLASLYDGWI